MLGSLMLIGASALLLMRGKDSKKIAFKNNTNAPITLRVIYDPSTKKAEPIPDMPRITDPFLKPDPVIEPNQTLQLDQKRDELGTLKAISIVIVRDNVVIPLIPDVTKDAYIIEQDAAGNWLVK
jgi:hypothetical protein